MNTPTSPHHQLKPSASSTGRQSTFQNRANNLVKRLGLLTSKFGASSRTRGTDDNTKECIQTHPYRGTRSMDLMRSEPYLSTPMLAVNFKSQPLDRRSVDDSIQPHSQLHASNIDYVHVKTPSLSGTVAQGLTVATVVAGAGLGPRSDIQSAAGVVNRARSEERKDSSSTHANTRSNDSQTVGARAESLQGSVAATVDLESVQRPIYDTPSESPSSSRRPVVARLRTLPPLNLNMRGVGQEQRTLRLSPSVIVRPPPFPILELPALPGSAAESTSSSRTQLNIRMRPAVRLNSMPMLPMEGQDERENDPDHEDYGLEEDEVDEDEESEEEISGATVDSDDDDDDVSGRPTSSSRTSSTHDDQPGRARGLPPLLPNLLPMPTFSPLLGSSVGLAPSSAESGQYPASSEQAGKLQRDEAATPKAANGNRDYFSFSFAGAPDDRTKDRVYESPHFNAPSPRTPTARDYSQASNNPHMLPVALPTGSDTKMNKNGINPTKTANAAGTAHLPMANSSAATASLSKRPGVYQQASKSMVELFTSATAPSRDGYASGSVGMDVKGKRTDADTNLQGHISNTMSGNGKAANNKRSGDTSINASTSPFCTSSNGRLMAAGVAQAHLLRRQHSMPSFAGSGPPPPYPIFSRPDPHHPNNPDRFFPMPREDEGKEALPPYTNDIRLTAVLPRKMEFTAPGVQAQDRKWRRLHCVLEGTAFKVYEAPRRISGVGAIVGWWERKVGAGDVSLSQTGSVNDATGGPSASIIKKGPKRRMKWEELQAEEERNAVANAESGLGRGSEMGAMDIQQDPHMNRSKRNIASALLHPTRSRISSRAPSPSSSFASPRSSFQIARSSVDLPPNSVSSAPTSARPSADLSPSASASNLSSAANSHFRRHMRPEGGLQPQPKVSHSRSQSQPLNRTQDQISMNTRLEPGEGEVPLRVYSLQHSESGLASDYTKRRNVVRVRMEGEQFLLQCTDVAAVVEWIEGLQAAANVSLDLDERPMPKGPIFPRRRRRRRAQPPANRPTGTTS